jgi:hypothetical protein
MKCAITLLRTYQKTTKYLIGNKNFLHLMNRQNVEKNYN